MARQGRRKPPRRSRRTSSSSSERALVLSVRRPLATPAVRASLQLPRELLEEAPTAHVVCRVCGRISRFVIPLDEELGLERTAQARPPGWSADRITLSVAGACPRCRGVRPV